MTRYRLRVISPFHRITRGNPAVETSATAGFLYINYLFHACFPTPFKYARFWYRRSTGWSLFGACFGAYLSVD